MIELERIDNLYEQKKNNMLLRKWKDYKTTSVIIVLLGALKFYRNVYIKHAQDYSFKVIDWVKWHSMYRPHPRHASGLYM